MNSKGKAKLATVLQKRMNQTNSNASSPVIELGTIMGNKSLIIDDFPEEIPNGEYYVCKSSVLEVSLNEQLVSSDIKKSFNALRQLESGDRVLVAWVGSTAIVIDTVIMSERE